MLKIHPLKISSREYWTRILFSLAIFLIHSTSFAANKCMSPDQHISYLDTPCPAGYKDMGEINEQNNSTTSTETPSSEGIRQSEKKFLNDFDKEKNKKASMRRKEEASDKQSNECDKLGRKLRYYQNQSGLSSEDKEHAYWQKRADDTMTELNKKCIEKK